MSYTKRNDHGAPVQPMMGRTSKVRRPPYVRPIGDPLSAARVYNLDNERRSRDMPGQGGMKALKSAVEKLEMKWGQDTDAMDAIVIMMTALFLNLHKSQVMKPSDVHYNIDRIMDEVRASMPPKPGVRSKPGA